jgi:hypothetical protein
MDDLERIPIFDGGRAVDFAADNVAVQLHDDAAGPNLKSLEQLSHGKPFRDFSFFSVNPNLHRNEKNRTHYGHSLVAREYG